MIRMLKGPCNLAGVCLNHGARLMNQEVLRRKERDKRQVLCRPLRPRARLPPHERFPAETSKLLQSRPTQCEIREVLSAGRHGREIQCCHPCATVPDRRYDTCE